MRSLHIIKWMHIKRYTYWTYICTCGCMGFPGHASCKNPPANAEGIRDTGSVPGWGRSPGGGLGNSLQYSCLENPRDRRAWGATVHRVAELEWLKWLSTCSVCMYLITFTITSPEKPPLQSTMDDGHCLVCGVKGLWVKLLYLLINISVTLPQCYLLRQWIKKFIHQSPSKGLWVCRRISLLNFLKEYVSKAYLEKNPTNPGIRIQSLFFGQHLWIFRDSC